MRPLLIALGGLLWLGCAATPRTPRSVVPSACPAGREPVAWSSVYLDNASGCALTTTGGRRDVTCWQDRSEPPRPGARVVGEVEVWHREVPASVAHGLDARTELFAGHLGTCFKTGAQVTCMDGSGQAGGTTFVADHMASGDQVTCMSRGSRLQCHGDGVAIPMRTQADFVFSSDITEIAIGVGAVCVVLQDGTASCLNGYSASSTGWETFGPGITHVASNLFNVCAYDEARRWGRCKTREGSLAFEKVVKMVSDSESFCVLTERAEVLCWAAAVTDAEAPNARWDVRTVMTGVTNLWAGRLKTCALTQPGAVYCWGHGVPVETASSTGPQLVCL